MTIAMLIHHDTDLTAKRYNKLTNGYKA